VRKRSQATAKKYANGRYKEERFDKLKAFSICEDLHLERKVYIDWIAGETDKKAIRQRLIKLQSVQSPYVALIYDMVVDGDRVGIVQEDLPNVVEKPTPEHQRARIYELCAALTALYEKGLAHGAVGADCFRVRDPQERGRLCNLSFAPEGLDEPITDYVAFIALLKEWGAHEIEDDVWQALWQKLEHDPDWFDVAELRDRMKALLLENQHRALFYATRSGKTVELNKNKRTVRYTHPIADVGTIKVKYDGTRFLVAEVSGEVHINNMAVTVGQELLQSCVIVLGDADKRSQSQRYSITFDQSHPEVP